MKFIKVKNLFLAAAVTAAAVVASNASAAIVITEVAPWGSGGGTPSMSTPYATDWFELTNTGTSAVNISGWKMDDNSNSFSSAVTLTGITSIAAHESVIFTENAAPTFLSTWFGGTPPAGLQIGNYTGSGVGLSQTADAVNIYNAAGVLQANVSFAASDAISPYQTIDNAAGLNNTTISTLSVIGVHGAFVAANDAGEIGSPGTIAAVPEADSYAMLLAGLVFAGFVARHKNRNA